MNKIELVGLIREIVKDELKELLKSKEGRAVVREMIGKEVRIEVDRLLTEMEQSQSEVISEAPQDTKLSRMVERGELPPKTVQQKPVVVPKVEFTKNPKLNALLNDTYQQLATGKASLPSAMGPEAQAQLLKEQYAKTMTAGGFPVTPHSIMQNPPSEDSGKSVDQMLPDVDVNGNPLVVRNIPDHVGKALTRNYSKLMKKVEEKRG